ncbi:MAG: asparagine synthetase B family protein, partial [Thermoguttaceae bacterium]
LCLPSVPRRLDYQALEDYLIFGYPLVPKTLFCDIRELEPGCWIALSPRGMEEGRFWRWRREERPCDEPTAVAATKDTLLEALRGHLIADVPIGVLLSGGIDSSLLVSLLKKELNADLEAFTVRFGEADYDESPYARIVADHLGVRHHELLLPSGTASFDQIHGIMDQFDQPFADSSAIPTYLISQELRKHVRVVIGGDGGDEMFGGYPRFYYADVSERLGRLPPLVVGMRLGARALAAVAPNTMRKFARLLAAAGADGNFRLMNLSCYVYPQTVGEALAPRVRKEIAGYVPQFALPGQSACDGRSLIDATVQYALPGDYLRKVDIASSAHGLEVRVPFLANQVLDFASRLPHRLKYTGIRSAKKLLRDLLARYVPPSILNHPKTGFGIPIDRYLSLRQRKVVFEMLTGPGSRIAEILNMEHFTPVLRGFVDHRWDRSRFSRYMVYQHAYLLWSLERWLRKWNPST